MSMKNIKFNQVLWNSMELFSEKLEAPWNSTVLGSIDMLVKFHWIPWNHRCSSNIVQKVPWNSEESSIELSDENKFQWTFKRDLNDILIHNE